MTEGDVIDYDVIRKDIGELGTRFDIKEIAADRWNASQIITQLTGDGFMVVPFGQGFASMAFPTKRLMELVLGKRIAHGGNPVLRWMASNVSAKKDAAGNLKPDKEKSTEKIDGIVAIIMALGRAEVNASEDEEFTGEVFSF
jgi:phage terminase large subunit-like protein